MKTKQMTATPDINDGIINPNLISNINKALFALCDGKATVEEIDDCMMVAGNLPIGPLALADDLGLDTVLDNANYLYYTVGDPKYRPCPLLARMIHAGYLGRKSGKGFYSYNS